MFVRFYTFGIGPEACPNLVQGVAGAARGQAHFIADDERMPVKVNDMQLHLDDCSHPRLPWAEKDKKERNEIAFIEDVLRQQHQGQIKNKRRPATGEAPYPLHHLAPGLNNSQMN